MKQKVEVWIDSREREPFKFPSLLKVYPNRDRHGKNLIVAQKKVTMLSGDYHLRGHSESCIVERKKHIGELMTNLFTDDRKRALDAFTRLESSTANPYLVIESSIKEMSKTTRWIPEPTRVQDELAWLIEKFRLRLILLGPLSNNRKRGGPDKKIQVGEFLLRIMLAHAVPGEFKPELITRILRGEAQCPTTK